MLVSRELRDSEEKFRKAFASSPIGFATVDDARRIVDANATFCQLTGYDLGRLRKMVFPDLIHPEDLAENMALNARMMAGEIPGFVIENRFVRKGGEPVWVRKSVSVARGPDGKVKWVYALVEDVTDRHCAEQQLKKLNAELEARIAQEVRARESAQAQLVQSEKLSALGQLAGGVAHDFNNILQAVVGGADLIERQADDPARIKTVAQLLRDTALRGASITRRLLAFARRDQLHAELVDVVALVDGLRELLSPALGVRIKVEIDTQPDILPAKADPNQLETVLINLATNAADAIPGDGVIRIRAREDIVGDGQTAGQPVHLAPGHYIRIETIDTGVGMDEATLARAGEPFFTTKPVGRGTGLGLSMARGFAEQSGGALAICSTVGQGTAVTIWLPRAEAPESVPIRMNRIGAPDSDRDAYAPTAKDIGVLSPQAAIQRRVRVLFVDDDPIIRELVADELAHHGFDVVHAEGGMSALEKIDAGEDIALIVSDLSMPGMDGFAFLREALRRRPGLPGIVLTGYAGDAAALTLDPLLGKTVTLLRKPVEAAVLAERIAIALSARG
jgi:PAS domain S-box-containing protein